MALADKWLMMQEQIVTPGEWFKNTGAMLQGGWPVLHAALHPGPSCGRLWAGLQAGHLGHRACAAYC